MTNDTRDNWKRLDVAASAAVKKAFAMRSEWKKKMATEAHVSSGAAVATSEKPTSHGVEAVGSAREGK